jgi:hypothetical protein
MSLLVILLILALIFGGVGLFVSAAKWALILAVIFIIASVVVGMGSRGRRGI